MKKILAILAMVLVIGVGSAEAQDFPYGAPLRAVFEPPVDPDESTAQVQRYEFKFDQDAVYVNTGVSQLGQAEYQFALPQGRLTPGPHTLYVRACNTRGCGAELAASFNIQLPLPGVPRAPAGGVIRLQSQQVMSVPRAQEYAQAYSLWSRDRYLTMGELGWLASQWDSAKPLTKTNLLSFLDGVQR